MDALLEPGVWIGLLTLVGLEVVLGIDNIIFISILASKLPAAEQKRARQIGIGGAVITRILLLLSLAWVIGLTKPLFTILGQEISGRDLILIIGGLFLVAKATHEIHGKLEGEGETIVRAAAPSLVSVVIQIMLLDIIFSLDSVITAVGMVDELWVMIAAVLIAAGFMVFAAGAISDFVHRHPTLKMLALSFLILIGVTLLLDGLQRHIPKGYVYFAMGFSVLVEMLNLRIRGRANRPIELREPHLSPEPREQIPARP